MIFFVNPNVPTTLPNMNKLVISIMPQNVHVHIIDTLFTTLLKLVKAVEQFHRNSQIVSK